MAENQQNKMSEGDGERIVKDESTETGYRNNVWTKKENNELIIDALEEGYKGIPKYHQNNPS